MKRYVIDRVRDSITTHPENKFRPYIEAGGRGTERPLSYSTVGKTFYSFFICGELLTTPFNYKFEEGENPRQLEIEQIVRLMNIIAEKIYIGRFDHSRGIRRIENDVQKGVDVDENHLRAFRMGKEEIIHNWLRYVRQIIQNYFITIGYPIDEKKLFQYRIPDHCWENIERFIDSLSSLPLWVNKDLANTAFGGKRNYNYWQSIFSTGRTPDGSDVMHSGTNLMEMIQQK